MDWTLTNTTTPGLSECVGDVNDGVHYISKKLMDSTLTITAVSGQNLNTYCRGGFTSLQPQPSWFTRIIRRTTTITAKAAII